MTTALVVCPDCAAKNRVPTEKEHLQAKCGRCGASLQGAARTGVVIGLNDANFGGIVEQSPLPVMVDFYSPTCGPCKMVAPLVENIAASFAGRAVVCKLDTSTHQTLASRFQIRGVPTMLFFKDGQLVDQVVGAAGQPELERRLEQLL
ncbi:thioredoxin family protein [Desulfogranum mediterraneum]|uniref:thioredoxin family protein n=1 Tax=Desulfogranum mediterraneum TaxID=160661 RepID=UPI0003F59106|nr:thioredoxin domain-containing protein [Desulfogranum mediterraneum]